MVLKYFGASLQAIRPDMTHITSYGSVIRIKHLRLVLFLFCFCFFVFCLVRKILYGLVKNM